MAAKRLLSFIIAAFLIVNGVSKVYKGYQHQRVADYMSSASGIHQKVQATFEKFGKKNDEMKKQLAAGDIDPKLFEDCEAGLKEAAKVSREQKEKLAKLTPPESVARIHEQTLDFFEKRAKFAEDAIPFYQTVAEYSALEREIGDGEPTAEQQAIADEYDAKLSQLTSKMQEQATEIAEQDASLGKQIEDLNKD